MKKAFRCRLAGSALMLGGAVLVRVLDRPLVPLWLMVTFFVAVAVAFVTVVIRLRAAVADSAAKGSAVWSWPQVPRPS